MKLSTFLIAFAFLLFNCSDDNSEANTKNTHSPTTEYYFLGTVDGNQVLVEEKDDLEFIGSPANSSSTFEGCSGGFKSGLYKVSNSGGITLTPLSISFYGAVHLSQPCNDASINETFFSQLTTGDYKLSWVENDITTVGLHYYDSKNQKSWNSSHKDQESEQSFFTVDKIAFLGVDDSGKKMQKIEGRFSSYLYEFDFDEQVVTDSIFISDAKFVYRFISE